jgi:serine/threonine-protein kinase RsbW
MTAAPGAFEHASILRDPGVDVGRVQGLVADALRDHGYDESAIFAIRLALEEAIVNGFRHGNKSDPAKAVHFGCTIDAAAAAFDIQDEGPGFDPNTVPDPTEDENIEIPSGRGIMLIKAYMTEVSFYAPGNHLHMLYRKPA